MAHLDAVATRVIDDTDADELDRTPVRSYWELARQRFLRNRMAVAGLIVLTLLVIASIAIPALTGNTWQTALLSKVNAPPEIGTAADGQMVFAPLGYSDIGRTSSRAWPRRPARASPSVLRRW